jgi:carboxylate-amine ligase
MTIGGTADVGRDWAIWRTASLPWTVGLEEEIMLLDGRTWEAANRVVEALELAPEQLRPSLSADTHACMLEIKTRPHATVGAAAGELEWARAAVDALLRRPLALRAAVAGTNPLLDARDVRVSAKPRYAAIEREMRAMARREPTMALHVHVAVPDADAAVRALDGLRGDVPALLALSANSPFWRGVDSGFASIRTPIMSMFPRTGVPRRFGSYGAWVEGVWPLVASRAIPDPGFLWWDVRLQPRLGTVEVRVMDAQTRLPDSAALAAIVQCLVVRYAERDLRPGAPSPEVLGENRFLAARDGLAATVVDGSACGRHPIADDVVRLLDACGAVASGLGCAAQLAGAGRLAREPGDTRQRRFADRDGVAALPARLAAEFAPGAADAGTMAAAALSREA